MFRSEQVGIPLCLFAGLIIHPFHQQTRQGAGQAGRQADESLVVLFQ